VFLEAGLLFGRCGQPIKEQVDSREIHRSALAQAVRLHVDAQEISQTNRFRRGVMKGVMGLVIFQGYTYLRRLQVSGWSLFASNIMYQYI
jgi:hypothetical protein